MCEECGFKDSEYCLICKDFDMFKTKDEKEYLDYMCDLLCGDSEED